MTLRQAIFVVSILAPTAAICDDASPPPPMGVWSGKGQLGFVEYQGNTSSKSANGMLDAGYLEGPWKHTFHLEGLYGQSAGVTAAERWAALWQSNYAINQDLFAFGALRYAYDLFSGFQYQDSAAAGMGYNIFKTDATKLSAQLGAGYRTLRPEELTKNPAGEVIGRTLEARQNGAIATAGVDFSQRLSSTTTLSDKLLTETGSSDTLFNDVLALTVKMTTKLALSVGYSLQDNTKPPAGLKKLDTVETVNLVFGF